MILNTEIDYTLGGWGQDGHVAFNQARRDPYTQVTLDDIRNSTARIQNNNTDTILALAHRKFWLSMAVYAADVLDSGCKRVFSGKENQSLFRNRRMEADCAASSPVSGSDTRSIR